MTGEINNSERLKTLDDSQLNQLSAINKEGNLSSAVEFISADKEITKDELKIVMALLSDGLVDNVKVLDADKKEIQQKTLTPQSREMFMKLFDGLLSQMLVNGFSIGSERDIYFLESRGYDLSQFPKGDLVGKILKFDGKKFDISVRNPNSNSTDNLSIGDTSLKTIGGTIGAGIVVCALEHWLPSLSGTGGTALLGEAFLLSAGTTVLCIVGTGLLLYGGYKLYKNFTNGDDEDAYEKFLIDFQKQAKSIDK